MCGILFNATGVAVEAAGETHSGLDALIPTAEDFYPGLACRGPDAKGCYSVNCGAAHLSFHGSLLQLRGTAPSSTPLLDAGGNVLLFNGQLFGGGMEVLPGSNDAQLLLAALGQPVVDVPSVLTSLQGPWALAFWQAATRTLWFGRDPIGRRSLLLHLPRPEDGRLLLSSSAPLDAVVPFEGFHELPPGIYSVALQLPGSDAGDDRHGTCSSSSSSHGSEVLAHYVQHEWSTPAVRQLAEFRRAAHLIEPPSEAAPAAAAAAAGSKDVPSDAEAAAAGREEAPSGTGAAAAAAAGAAAEEDEEQAFERTVDGVLAALRRAVATRCLCIDHPQSAGSLPPLASGTAHLPGPPEQPGELALESLRIGSLDEPGVQQDLQQQATQPLPPPLPLLPPAPILILFSGGVDSTLLAALAHEALPAEVPIDLASVCFDDGHSPDRQSALDALAELRQLAPTRQWRLIQVDCSLSDVDALRPRLLRLLAPADTVMDLNIGAALWLATRAEGELLQHQQQAEGSDAVQHQQEGQQQQQAADAGSAAGKGTQCAEPEQQQQSGTSGLHPAQQQQPAQPAQQPQPQQQQRCCRSAARVVLLGHGADELCGGYGRHRTAFRERGWAGLGAELALDLRRLWLRNLGRDDRLVADHGREARHPFLDEGVVAAVLAAPLHHVADLRQVAGQGDKRVLRRCLQRLGLPRAATRAKRAIQFGSRLAAKTNAAQFGGTRRANQANAGSVRLADVAPLSARLAPPVAAVEAACTEGGSGHG